jgi:hypothetical protein
VEGLFGKRGLQSFVYEVAILELQVMKYLHFALFHLLGCILVVFSLLSNIILCTCAGLLEFRFSSRAQTY